MIESAEEFFNEIYLTGDFVEKEYFIKELEARDTAIREQAVLEERERCAKILDARHQDYQNLALKSVLGTDSDLYYADQCVQEDADLIRRGASHE